MYLNNLKVITYTPYLEFKDISKLLYPLIFFWTYNKYKYLHILIYTSLCNNNRNKFSWLHTGQLQITIQV